MTIYKFKIGETVFLKPSRDQNLPRGAYVVIRKLPEHAGEYEYRVRSCSQRQLLISKFGGIIAT